MLHFTLICCFHVNDIIILLIVMYFNYTLSFLPIICLYNYLDSLILVIMAIVNNNIIAVYFSYYHCHCLPMLFAEICILC